MKLLIVKIGAIGDVLMARGMVAAALAADFSGVTWLCGKSVTPLVREFKGVSEILEIDDAALLQGGTLAKLKVLAGVNGHLAGRRFDLIATAHSDPRYAWLTRSARAGWRRSFATHRLVPGRAHADEYARLVHGLEGPAAPQALLAPLRQARPRAKTALLFPGGAKNLLRDDALRRWPIGHYVSLAQGLLKRGWKVAVAGAESDRWILPSFAGLKVEDRVARWDLPQTLDACAAAAVVVTHDSGPLHLALASASRVVALFGPTQPAEKVAARPGVTALWGGAHLACRPCYDGKNYAPCAQNICLDSLSPAAVLAAAEGRRAL